MHADRAVSHRAQQSDRVVTGDDGIRRVILDTEVSAIGDQLEQLEEDVHLLGEFGILPEAVFVVVFETQDDVVLASDGQRLIDAIGDPFQTLSSFDFGVALAGENPAHGARASQPLCHGDQLRLPIDGTLAGVGVGIGEVGGAAKHRHREACPGDRFSHAIEISRLETGEESVVHLQTIGVERPGLVDPVEHRHRAIAGDLVDITLGEGGNFHFFGQLSVVSCQFFVAAVSTRGRCVVRVLGAVRR